MAADEFTPITTDDDQKRARHNRNARYYAAHREEMIERAKRYAAENADARKQYRLRHYKENRETMVRRSTDWLKAHPDYKRQNDAHYYDRHAREISGKHAERRADPAYRVRILVKNAKVRAKKSGMAFDDSLIEMARSVPPACPCCKTRFDYEGRHNMRSPSLDRLDNANGYTRVNTRIICYRCNTLKSDATIEELEAILAYMRGQLTSVG